MGGVTMTSFNVYYEEIDLALKIIENTVLQQIKIIRVSLEEMKREYEHHVSQIQNDDDNGKRPEEWRK